MLFNSLATPDMSTRHEPVNLAFESPLSDVWFLCVPDEKGLKCRAGLALCEPVRFAFVRLTKASTVKTGILVFL